MVEPLPGLAVTAGLTDRQLNEVADAVRAGLQPRVRLLSAAGQVAGRRGRVVFVGDRRGVGVECIRVRLDGDDDVLPFALDELALTAARAGGRRGAAAAVAAGEPEEGSRRARSGELMAGGRRGLRSVTSPRSGWTVQRALDLLMQGYSVGHVADLSGYPQPFLQAHLHVHQRRR